MSGRLPNTWASEWTLSTNGSRLREIPHVKAGRALRFDLVALKRYIEQHTIETID